MMATPSGPKLPGWYRALATLVGVVSIVLAIVVLVDPALGVLTLVFLLGFALLVIGIDRIIAGITGHPFGFMPTMMPAPGTPPAGGPKSP